MVFNADIEKLIASEISALGFECIGVEFDNHSNPRALRVYADVFLNAEIAANNIDTAINKSGITLDDCGKISYHLNKCLSVYPNLNLGDYVLEVSSPGVERRLFNLLQFERYIGREVKLRVAVPLNGKSNFIGLLCSVDHVLNRVFLEVDGQNLYFDFDNIAKANLIYRKL